MTQKTDGQDWPRRSSVVPFVLFFLLVTIFAILYWASAGVGGLCFILHLLSVCVLGQLVRLPGRLQTAGGSHNNQILIRFVFCFQSDFSFS